MNNRLRWLAILLFAAVLLTSFSGCSGRGEAALEQMGEGIFTETAETFDRAKLTPSTVVNILDHYPLLGLQRALRDEYDIESTVIERTEALFGGEKAYKDIAGKNVPKDAVFFDMITEQDRLCHNDWELENEYFITGGNVKTGSRVKVNPNVSMYGVQFSVRQLYLQKAWDNPVRELVSFGWCTHQKSTADFYPVVKAVYEELREKYAVKDSALEKALESETAFLSFVGGTDTAKILATVTGEGFEGKVRLTLHPPYRPDYKLTLNEPLPYLTIVWQKEDLAVTGDSYASYFRGEPHVELQKQTDPSFVPDASRTAVPENFALDY